MIKRQNDTVVVNSPYIIPLLSLTIRTDHLSDHFAKMYLYYHHDLPFHMIQTILYLLYFLGYKTDFFPSKTIPKI